MWRHLAAALNACRHPAVTWYEASERAFAGRQPMNAEEPLELATILGHTEMHGHLWVALFSELSWTSQPNSCQAGATAGRSGRRRVSTQRPRERNT
jgi:hypothetical protein